MPLQAPGIGSNLDINSLVSQLMQIERRPLAVMAASAQAVRAKVSALGTLKSALATFQGAAAKLDDIASFRAYQASVADSSVLTVIASSTAAEGTHAIEVSALAQQHKLRSTAFAGVTTTIGTGTLTIQFGTYDSGGNTFTANALKPTQAVTLGAGQDSLASVRDAINQAGIGVSAALVNDGIGERLVITSTDSGVANSLKITVADDDGIHTDQSGLSQLAFDPTLGAGSGKNLTQSVAAQNASLIVDGITVSKASNLVSDVIAGVTLTLTKAAPGTPTTLAVSRDTAKVRGAVGELVNAYNALSGTLGSLTGYNAATATGGPLQGDAAALNMQSRLRSLASGTIAGAGTYSTLSQVGVAFQNDGTLALDATKFDAAAASQFEDLARLFATSARASDARVSYVTSSASTQPGTYAIALSQVATRGALTGAQSAGLTITGGVNDQLDVVVDGTTASITLSSGTYASAAALAAELQSKLNGTVALTLAGRSVEVSENAGVLTLTSSRYGAGTTVASATGTAALGLFGASPASTIGVDAAGTLDGVAATADGQILIAAATGATAGLQLRVASSVTGAHGTLSFGRGLAAQFARLMDNFLDTTSGIDTRIEGMNASLKTNQQRQDAFEARMTGVEARLRNQFTALDLLMSRMTNTSNYLQQQLANLPKIGN